MATVRFSEQLKFQIISNAKAIYKVKLDRIHTKFEESNNLGEDIYQELFGNTLDSMPDWYFSHEDAMQFDGFYNVNRDDAPEGISGDDWVALHTTDVESTWQYPKKHALPDSMSSDTFARDMGAKCSWRNVSLDYTNSKWDVIKEKVMSYAMERAEVNKQKRIFIDGVESIMKEFSTLAPALKKWQPLWELVPEEYQERHKRINEKVEKRVVPSNDEVDLDKLTSVVVGHKLTE